MSAAFPVEDAKEAHSEATIRVLTLVAAQARRDCAMLGELQVRHTAVAARLVRWQDRDTDGSADDRAELAALERAMESTLKALIARNAEISRLRLTTS